MNHHDLDLIDIGQREGAAKVIAEIAAYFRSQGMPQIAAVIENKEWQSEDRR